MFQRVEAYFRGSSGHFVVRPFEAVTMPFKMFWLGVSCVVFVMFLVQLVTLTIQHSKEGYRFTSEV